MRKKNSESQKSYASLICPTFRYVYIYIYIYLCVCLCIIRISAVDILLIDTKPRFVAFDLFVFAIL